MKNSSKNKASKNKASNAPEGPAGSVALYLISPSDVSGAFPDRLARALDAGQVAAFQFRVKGVDEHTAALLAEPLQRICAERGVAFIVNDSISLAKRLGADGVHLGQGDGAVADAREQLGQEAQIGVTCHASRHLAMDAGEVGADYVAFGAFFPTTTKEVEHYADLETLTWWQSIFEIPCVAIGGITPQNCAPLVQAGADFLAISGAVWNGDEAANIRAFHEAISAAWNPVAAPSADSDVPG
ncbi:MAG: thiamine phosphate synthase [Novosphingobium sp.]|nr:thiamine phosphate synthase [Novosphingobium sp.]